MFKKYKFFFLLIIIIISALLGSSYKKSNNAPSLIENASISELRKITPAFASNAVNEIALIMMVKNEEDIIFENLAWHFSLGFRKFIIINNLSTDQTKQKIESFIQLTKDHTKVFVIEDPIFEYIQSRITTGAYDFARSVWPEVKWFFPVDADEFWLSEHSLQQTLSKIPEDIDMISSVGTRYYASNDYYNFDPSSKFYQKLHYRTNHIPLNEKPKLSKIAIRAKNNILIHQGNHSANRIDNCNNTPLKSMDGNIIGITMYEYPVRSPEQIHKKLFNGMQANLKAKELGVICKQCGSHWDGYANYLKNNDKGASDMKFRETFIDPTIAIDDPLPIEEALIILNKICQITSQKMSK